MTHQAVVRHRPWIARSRIVSVVLLAVVLALSMVGLPAAPVLAVPYCAEGEMPIYRFGFAQLKEALGATMGEPSECEHAIPFVRGNVQPTTTGVAYFLESEQIASFSDGFKVWRLTTEGVVEADVDLTREAGKLRVLPIGIRDNARCLELGQADRAQDLAAGQPVTRSAFPRTGTGLIFFINTGEGGGFEWIDGGVVTARVGIAYATGTCWQSYLEGYRGSPLPAGTGSPPAPAAKPPAPKPAAPKPSQPASGASFVGATMIGTKFNGANLTGANFTNANLTNAEFVGATLMNANFTNANLTGAKLDGANLDGAIWSNTTCPDGSNSDGNGGTCVGH